MVEASPRVLIVEDDEDIASALSRGLAREGYDPVVAQDIASATDLAGRGCDAAIVDVMLGDQSGTDLVRQLRADGMSAPIIILSALSGVDERASGLEAGADDYVAKPFEFSELVARLKVQERRRIAEATQTIAVAGLRYDPETREVEGASRSVALTEREGDLLAYLIRNAGHVVSRGDIFLPLAGRRRVLGKRRRCLYRISAPQTGTFVEFRNRHPNCKREGFHAYGDFE